MNNVRNDRRKFGFRALLVVLTALVALGGARGKPDGKKAVVPDSKTIPEEHRSKPEADYLVNSINDFRVCLNRDWFDPQMEQCRKIIQNLRRNIEIVVLILPPECLKKLNNVTIWVEWDESDLGTKANAGAGYGAACYVPRESEVSRRGYWRGGVVVLAANCLSGKRAEYTERTYPFWLLHELAHAYHDRMSVREADAVTSTYRRALARKLYEEPTKQAGAGESRPRILSYARRNEQEYFAELTVTYLARNVGHPFTESDLYNYDSGGFLMMYQTWGRKNGQLKRIGQAVAEWLAASCARVVNAGNAMLRTLGSLGQTIILDIRENPILDKCLLRPLEAKVLVGECAGDGRRKLLKKNSHAWVRSEFSFLCQFHSPGHRNQLSLIGSLFSARERFIPWR